MNPKTEIPADEIACAECGRFGVIEMAGKFLCSDCITQAGCACGGSDDDE